MVQARTTHLRVIGTLALLLSVSLTTSGCDVAAALRHEDEVAQQPTNGAAPVATEITNQHWGSSEISGDSCDSTPTTLNGIRVGRHDGYDRVVFDLSGQSEPCFRVYLDPDPVQDGSGLPVSLGNLQALRVEISGLGPDFPTIAPGYSAQLSGDAVSYVFFDTFFEGVATNFIAVAPESTGPRVYAVSVQPGQLIVDVAPLTE